MRRYLKRWTSTGLILFGCLLILAGVAYGGYVQYLAWSEGSSPSTGQVLVTNDGTRIPLEQPAPRATRPAALSPSSQSLGDTQVQINATPGTVQAGIAPLPSSDKAAPSESGLASNLDVNFLPPTRILIPQLGMDWPVVLSNGVHMPKYKGVGWFLGSAYPGHQGNLVLFGHLDGTYATFGKLHLLKPGDTFNVLTSEGMHVYRVTSLYETPRDDVRVLAPTEDASVTLITCSGHWDRALQDYTDRLIVKGDYIGH